MNQNNTVIGAYQRHSFDDEDAFAAVSEAMPKASGHDLLVKVAAVSVNPVDVGAYAGIRRERKSPKVLGWDAVGTVVSVGNLVSLFKVGERVFYAGDFRRAGSDQDYQLVDERIVGNAPEGFARRAIGKPAAHFTHRL